MTCPCSQSKPNYTNNAFNSEAIGSCNNLYGCMEGEAVDINQIPVDEFEKAPDYFITIRTKEDKSDGSIAYQPMLTPGASVLPAQNMANIQLLPTNNLGLKVEPGQVLPAYVENNASQTVIHPADENHPAQFIVLDVLDNGMAKCQNCGWVRMPVGHKYIIGANYYRSDKEGELTTDPGQTGQYLFTPVGRFTLALEIKRGV